MSPKFIDSPQAQPDLTSPKIRAQKGSSIIRDPRHPSTATGGTEAGKDRLQPRLLRRANADRPSDCFVSGQLRSTVDRDHSDFRQKHGSNDFYRSIERTTVVSAYQVSAN